MRIALFLVSVAALAGPPRFYDDDPVTADPKPRDASKAVSRKLSDIYDLFSNLFTRPGERQPAKGPPIRARAVNTLGEPYEPAWFTPRHYWKRLSAEALRRGPGDSRPPAEGDWTVVRAKSEGVTPGFTIVDARKRMYFMKFDPRSNPEMATGAEMVSSRLFHAVGYNVPENYLVRFTPGRLKLGKEVRIYDNQGRPRGMTPRDLSEILLKVPRDEQGRLRAVASLAVPGKVVGPFRWYGTRSDDPNDIVPHEHRRDLRALHVFSAWIDHDDSRAINNLDSLVDRGGVQTVLHFVQDFGSTLGSGSERANSPRSGGEYLFHWKQAAGQLFTLGLWVPYWARARFPDIASVGKFESEVFDPERWVPEYPNPAWLNRLPDDEFWAARQVAAFTDEDLRAIVAAGEYSDPRAAEWLVKCLAGRRDKIVRAYFAKVLPLDGFEIREGGLRWEDLGRGGKVGIQWSLYDNAADTRTVLPGETGARLPAGDWRYAVARLARGSAPSRKIDVFVRKREGRAEVVGIERFW